MSRIFYETFYQYDSVGEKKAEHVISLFLFDETHVSWL